jgi:circadian clock protein KaiC
VELSLEVRNRVANRSLRMVKYRGGASFAGESPFVVGQRGISVEFAGARPAASPSLERLTTGIERLDNGLQGGFLRGSSVRISGQPGTAKSTLAAAFAIASARRGERVLMVLFDEGAAQARRSLASVGLDLEKPLRQGLLHIESLSASFVSPEAHYVRITELVQELDSQHLILDPISALAKGDGVAAAASVAERLLEFAHSRGLTTLFTTLLETAGEAELGTLVDVSTLADIWISLSYNIRAGERNRALSIVKARGTQHSNQVRELVLSDRGPYLTDVFTEGGEVPMGTARLEHARASAAAQSAAPRAHAARVRELRETIAVPEQRAQMLGREISLQRTELSALTEREDARRAEELERMEAIGRSRLGNRDAQPSRVKPRRARQGKLSAGRNMPDHARHSRRRAGAVRAHLFVGGNTPRSLTARQALRFGLVATPTLLLERAGRSLPFIGDFSRRDELTEFLHGAFK